MGIFLSKRYIDVFTYVKHWACVNNLSSGVNECGDSVFKPFLYYYR